jgi:Mannitol-1-phosphate/altronate dehydrogenases
MKLNIAGIKNIQEWEKAGFIVPKFDVEKVVAETRANPTWVHFGAGNIFRAFPAARQQQLLDAGLEKTGIIIADGFDFEIIDAAFTPYDNLSISVVLANDGSTEKTVIASITESLKASSSDKDFARLKEIFRNPSLQMATFSITEKGYPLEWEGSVIPSVAEDFKNGPAKPSSFIGCLVSLLYERYQSGKKPVTLVSMDNCSHNGDKLRDAVVPFAQKWADTGLVDKDFVGYVSNPRTVSFPWTMIDKITPRPEEGVKKMLEAAGVQGMDITVTKKYTYIAPFVNAEAAAYLVVEDAFPNGRPALEKAGVIFTDRETVDKSEKMKVCTCLNPLHTAMGIYGNLLSFGPVSDAMKDPEILGLIKKIGYDEGLKVVADPGIINPKAFLDECVEKRFPNPYVPDTVQRLGVDMSQAIPVRYGETMKAYIADPNLDVASLVFLPLTFAGWCRYILGIDDSGKPFTVSPDPMVPEVAKHLEGVKLGDAGPFHKQLQPILSDTRIFALDLYKIGLGEKVEGYFAELMAAPGAVRKTLRKYLKG